MSAKPAPGLSTPRAEALVLHLSCVILHWSGALTDPASTAPPSMRLVTLAGHTSSTGGKREREIHVSVCVCTCIVCMRVQRG